MLCRSSEEIMAKIERFEDIKSWQEARKLTGGIYAITRNGSFTRDFALRDQLRRASVSIMANIAEGFGRRSNKEFSNFLNMAHGSAAEVQSHLYVALDQAYITPGDFKKFYSKVDEISKMIQAFMKYLVGKK
jgi:four helix bundle protein